MDKLNIKNMNTKRTVEIANKILQEIEDKKNGLTRLTFYRVITPSTFSNQTYIKTLDEAKEWISEWSKKTGEYDKYWEEQGKLCKIEKVTEISQSI